MEKKKPSKRRQIRMFQKHTLSVSSYLERNMDSIAEALAVVVFVAKQLVRLGQEKHGDTYAQNLIQTVGAEFRLNGWIPIHNEEALHAINAQSPGLFINGSPIIGIDGAMSLTDPRWFDQEQPEVITTKVYAPAFYHPCLQRPTRIKGGDNEANPM